MYKIEALNSNLYVSSTLPLEIAEHDYETRGRDEYRTPFPRVDAIRRNYKYQFLDIWRQIPNYIRESTSLKQFKRQLTNKFLDTY